MINKACHLVLEKHPGGGRAWVVTATARMWLGLAGAVEADPEAVFRRSFLIGSIQMFLYE
jgi:hypothetical protein